MIRSYWFLAALVACLSTAIPLSKGSNVTDATPPLPGSFAQAIWLQEGFRNMLRWAPNSETPGSMLYHPACVGHTEILEAWGQLPRPDFEKMAAEDVNAKPIHVSWGEFGLAREGLVERLSIPNDFRGLAWFSNTLSRPLRHQEDRTLASRLFLGAVLSLEASHFLRKGHWPETENASYHNFWRDVSTHYMNLAEQDSKWAESFASQVILLDVELGRWFWDREFARRILEEYAEGFYDMHREDAVMYWPEPGAEERRWAPPVAASAEIAGPFLASFYHDENRRGEYPLFDEVVQRRAELGGKIGEILMQLAIRDDLPDAERDRAIIVLTQYGTLSMGMEALPQSKGIPPPSFHGERPAGLQPSYKALRAIRATLDSLEETFYKWDFFSGLLNSEYRRIGVDRVDALVESEKEREKHVKQVLEARPEWFNPKVVKSVMRAHYESLIPSYRRIETDKDSQPGEAGGDHDKDGPPGESQGQTWQLDETVR